MDNREILTNYFTDEDIDHIWGTMYGSTNPTECIIKISKTSLKLSRNADAFIYIWGYPGPDGNIYKFADYGKTWAFTRPELSQYKTYDETHIIAYRRNNGRIS